MDAVTIVESALIDWSVAARPLHGEARSGDLHVVAPFPGGVLVAAVDGLGHGDDAADAAEAAARVLFSYPAEPVVSLLLRCHEALQATRGAAMSLASVASTGAVSWVGVGNVEATLFRCDGAKHGRESLILRGGVVGYRLPNLLPSTVSMSSRDLLVLTTDGIGRSSIDDMRLSDTPALIADDVLARFARDTDDALVLVARFQGDGR
jgi:hypothetical protein